MKHATTVIFATILVIICKSEARSVLLEPKDNNLYDIVNVDDYYNPDNSPDVLLKSGPAEEVAAPYAVEDSESEESEVVKNKYAGVNNEDIQYPNEVSEESAEDNENKIEFDSNKKHRDERVKRFIFFPCSSGERRIAGRCVVIPGNRVPLEIEELSEEGKGESESLNITAEVKEDSTTDKGDSTTDKGNSTTENGDNIKRGSISEVNDESDRVKRYIIFSCSVGQVKIGGRCVPRLENFRRRPLE